MIHGALNHDPMESADLLSTADAAKLLNLSSDMVRLLARSGRLRAAVTSSRGVRLFRRDDVVALEHPLSLARVS